jgi:hypothetical protein
VTAGRAILRGIKLAAYGFAALLVTLVVYDAMTLSPVAHPATAVDPDAVAVSKSAPQGGPTVPPPPPLPGQARSGVVRRAAVGNPGPDTREAARIREAGPAEEHVPGRVESSSIAGNTPVDTVEAPVQPAEAPAAIVIVRPPERPPQDNRGLRWIKAVGRALRIGSDKDQ